MARPGRSGVASGPNHETSSLLSVFDEPLPERGDLEDRDPLHIAEAQEVGVGAYKAVGAPRHRALEELVVSRIPAHVDRDVGTDEDGSTPDAKQHRAGFAGRHAELARDVRARGHRVELGKDRVGDEQDELPGTPRLVDARREALGAGEGTSQEDLRVKDGLERGQRAPPRR